MIKRKSEFIFMTANMISCWKVEEWTCSMRFWEQKVNHSAMRLSWLCGLLWTIDYCVVAHNHYCKFPKPVSCKVMHWHVRDGTLTNNIGTLVLLIMVTCTLISWNENLFDHKVCLAGFLWLKRIDYCWQFTILNVIDLIVICNIL